MVHGKTLGNKILVVGDAMLDRYWFGESSRLSPEAPVPVVNVFKQEVRLGGAANVVVNVSCFGGNVSFLGIVGMDEDGESIELLLHKHGIRSNLLKCDDFKTTSKLRILSQSQQVLRVDFETKVPKTALDFLDLMFMELLEEHNVVIFSDYGKGALYRINTMILRARKAGKLILVDPKGNDFSKYSGASIITPNKSELSAVVGKWKSENELTEKAQSLRQSLNIDNLLLTRSEEGMTLYDNDGEMSVEAQAAEVFDVSGAGDTVIAVLGSLLAEGYGLHTAIRIANIAGGIVVGKLGTSTISRSELKPYL